MVKKTGRPRKFEEADAIIGATKVFWAKGFDGATLDDLVAGMGVQRPSIYAIFGDKSALFMRCLDNYAKQLGFLTAQILRAPGGVHEAFRGFLRLSVENATGDDSPLGCFLVCVAPLVNDERVRAYLLDLEVQAVIAIEQRLCEGVYSNELPSDYPVGLRARQLVDLSRGMSVRARIGAAREVLLMDAEAGVELILGPKPANAGPSR